MKTLTTILIITLCFISFSSFKINNKNIVEKTVIDEINYHQLNEMLFNQKAESGSLMSSDERVIIINMRGDRIREDQVDKDNILSSAILMPLIRKSDFIMKINKTSYYLLSEK